MAIAVEKRKKLEGVSQASELGFEHTFSSSKLSPPNSSIEVSMSSMPYAKILSARHFYVASKNLQERPGPGQQ